MLNSIYLKSFKSFVEEYVALAPLTVLTGLNSSGKSSIIQAILMAQKAFEGLDSLVIQGHGALSDMKSTYASGDIVIRLEDYRDREFEVIIDPSPYPRFLYDEKKDDGFSFPYPVYVSASRFGPKPFVEVYNDHYKQNSLGDKGENLFQFIHNYEDDLIDDRIIHPKSEGKTVEYNIRGWLSEIAPNVKFTYSIDKNSDTSYSLFNGFRAANVGFGLSYSLSVIAALIIGTTMENSIVMIENPEAHLHPRGQVGLARLIALCSRLENCQVIIETHSDHVFDAIRAFSKESKDNFHENVAIHWFELDSNGNSQIESPTLDERGRLSFWPKGLFDQFQINSERLL